MANELSRPARAQIRALEINGWGVRAIARAIGISTNTVKRYLRGDGKCKCGFPSGHKGWCKWRYSMSVSRQAMHAAQRGVEIAVPAELKLSLRTVKRAKYKRWTEGAGATRGALLRVEQYGVIGEVDRACKKVPFAHREDVRSDLLVACFAGWVERYEIEQAAAFFLRVYLQATFKHIAYDPMDQDDSRVRAVTRAVERMGISS